MGGMMEHWILSAHLPQGVASRPHTPSTRRSDTASPVHSNPTRAQPSGHRARCRSAGTPHRAEIRESHLPVSDSWSLVHTPDLRRRMGRPHDRMGESTAASRYVRRARSRSGSPMNMNSRKTSPTTCSNRFQGIFGVSNMAASTCVYFSCHSCHQPTNLRASGSVSDPPVEQRIWPLAVSKTPVSLHPD